MSAAKDWVSHTPQELLSLIIIRSSDSSSKYEWTFKDSAGSSVFFIRTEGCVQFARPLGQSVLYTVRDGTAEINVKYCHGHTIAARMRTGLERLRERGVSAVKAWDFDKRTRRDSPMGFLLGAVQQDLDNANAMFLDGERVRVEGNVSMWKNQFSVTADCMYRV